MDIDNRPRLFERLMEGLTATEQHASGERTLRITEVDVPDPAPKYSGAEVQRIRLKIGLSQTAFCSLSQRVGENASKLGARRSAS